MILSKLEKKFLPSFKDFKLCPPFKFTQIPLKVLLLRDVKAVIKAMFKVVVLIDLDRTSYLESKRDQGRRGHIPKPNRDSVPLCPNVSPRVVGVAAQLHG
jgi:hypothetical protein